MSDKCTPMSRLVFARCAGLIAARSTKWAHEILCDASSLHKDANPDSMRRFCESIRDVIKQIECRDEADEGTSLAPAPAHRDRPSG